MPGRASMQTGHLYISPIKKAGKPPFNNQAISWSKDSFPVLLLLLVQNRLQRSKKPIASSSFFMEASSASVIF